MREVEKISVVNNAGFVMTFDLNCIDDASGEDKSIWSSSKYPINQTKSCDVSSDVEEKIAEGTIMWPKVHAVLGVTHNGDKVKYKKNGQTATYTVSGTTLIYHINLT